jgi:hypothetical protein
MPTEKYRRTNTCFVLGAGFCVPAGLPPQKDLLQGILDKKASVVRQHIQEIFNYHENSEILKSVALEDVFTFLDKIIAANKNIGGYDRTTAHTAKTDIIDYIIGEINAALQKLQGKSKYEYFFKSIVRRKINGETNTIVTVNWDTIPDFYINRAYKDLGISKGGVDYGCYDWDYDDKKGYVASILRKTAAYSTVKVLKLHGSINWAYSKEDGALYVREQTSARPEGLIIEQDKRKEFEHIFMTPTYIKDLSNLHTQSIWHNAGFDLSQARRVVFLGCSLPRADYEFRHLLFKTAVRRKDNKIRALINPKATEKHKQDTKNTFQTLFIGNDIAFREMDIAEFLERKDLIWDW